jgi:hypothetical protein
MPRIAFRGKTYNSEFEMPPDVRQAYRSQKKRRAHPNTPKPLTEIVDMPPEVRKMYERALGDVEEKLEPAQRPHELPKTEEIYRQSAPDDMKHLPSDESIYRPSQPLIDPAKPAIEPESALGMSRFISSIVWALILGALAFLVVQFLL